jgi:hypothetical protein
MNKNKVKPDSGLLSALMANDYSREEALEEISSMRERILNEGENPEDVLYEYELEPDYVMDLLF